MIGRLATSIGQGRFLLGLVLAAALLARLTVGVFVTDDAYITFRYSRNIASLGEFTYNPPFRVLGTTSPLLTIGLAGAELMGIPVEGAAFALSAVADLVTILAVVALLSIAGCHAAGLLAGAAIAVWPLYLTYSVSGMETSLYGALLTTAVWALAHERLTLVGLLAGFAILCRPDGLLMLPLLCLGGSASRPLKVMTAGMLKVMTNAAAVVVPWLLFAWWYFGSPIPNSLLAKAAGSSSLASSVTNIAGFFSRGPYLALTILAAGGAVVLWQARSVALRVWMIWWALYAAVFVAAGAFAHFPWYFVPLLPLYIGAASAGAEAMVKISATSVGRPRGAAPTEIGARRLMGASVVGMLAIGLLRIPAHKAHLAQGSTGREVAYRGVAMELAADEAGCTLAATEIGTLGFYYPGRILDLVGLVSPEAVGSDTGRVLRASDARWLVTYDTHFDRTIASSAEFDAAFRLSKTIRVGPERTLEIYERRSRARCVGRT